MPSGFQIISSILCTLENLAASKQLDGALDSSDEDESEESDDNIDNDDDDDLDKDDDEDVEHEDAAEEEPLNSEDDVTDEDSAEMFDTDNVIVCQYDKVSPTQYIFLEDIVIHLLCRSPGRETNGNSISKMAS